MNLEEINFKILGEAIKEHIEESNERTPEEIREEWLSNPNNMTNWFPKLVKTGVNIPKTKLVNVDYQAINDLVEKKLDTKAVIDFTENLKKALEEIGYPAFVRSSYSSNKHDWKDTCLIQRDSDLVSHLYEIAYYDAFASRFATIFAVRELIDTKAHFYAFDGKIPITKERRYFVNDGEVVCHHPYWPEESIMDPRDIKNNCVSDWKEKLEDMNFESKDEVGYLSELSKKVSKNFEGFWSVDWLNSKDGTWYCIDMALGNMSYHWKNCKYNLQNRNNP